jgi:MFS family permease
LVVGTLVNRIGLLVLPFLSIYLTARRGLTVEQATLVIGLHGAGAFAAGIAGGALADMLGRKAVLVGSLAGGAVLMASIPLASAFWHVAAIVAAYGFVGEMYRPAVSAVVADTVEPERQTRAFALLYWAINVGAAVGPALGGLLAERSFGLLFTVDAATMAVYAGVVAVGIRETRPVRLTETRAPGSRGALGHALRDGRLLGLAFVSFAVGTAFVQTYVTLPLVMRADGIALEHYGTVIGLNGAIVVLLSLPVSRWMEHRRGSGPLAAAVALIGLGVGAYAFADTPWEYAGGVVLLSLGEIAVLPVLPALIARLAPDGLRATYQGVHQSGWGLAHMVSPVVGGALLARFGPTALWGSVFGLGLTAAAVVLVFRLGDAE